MRRARRTKIRMKRTKKKMKKTAAVRNKNGQPKKESVVLAWKIQWRKALSQRKTMTKTRKTRAKKKRTMKAVTEARMVAIAKGMKGSLTMQMTQKMAMKRQTMATATARMEAVLVFQRSISKPA